MTEHYAFVGVDLVSATPGKPVILTVLRVSGVMILIPILFVYINNKILKLQLPSGLLCCPGTENKNPWSHYARNAVFQLSEVKDVS